MARTLFGGSSDDYAVDTNGRPLPNRRIRFYTSAAMTTEITDIASDLAGTGTPLVVSTNGYGFWGPVYLPDGTDGSDAHPVYAGAADGAGNPPKLVVRIYSHTAVTGGVSTFMTRTGDITLLKADVTSTGLAAADVGADATGTAATVQTNLTAEVTRAQAAEAALGGGMQFRTAVVVATTNQASLSGLPTVDGVTLTAGQVILLTAQSTGSQNGLWAVAVGAWARPSNFAVGFNATATSVLVESGTAGAGTTYAVTGATNNVVGTNVLTFVKTSGSAASLSSGGTWTASTAYTAGAVVTFQGSRYVCITAHTSGTTFDGTKWTITGGQLVTGRSSTAVAVASDWGSFWVPKRTTLAGGTGKGTIAIVGDSIARGYYTSNMNTKSMVALIKAAILAKYPFMQDAGTGFSAAYDSQAVSSAPLAGSTVTTTGTWTWFNDTSGPGCNGTIRTTNNGDTITFTCTVGPAGNGTVKMYAFQNAGLGTYSWTVDGGAGGSGTTAGALGMATPTLASGLAAGTHTIVVTSTSVSGLYVCGFSAEAASGLVLNNFARGGMASSACLPGSFGSGWNGGTSYPADLVFYCMGANDASGNVAGDTYLENVRKWLDQVTETTTPATDIVFLQMHYGKWEGATKTGTDYSLRLRALAESYGAAYVDLWGYFRHSWAYANSLSYWGVNNGTGQVGTDNVHLSDTGNTLAAAAIQSLLPQIVG